jgi:sigma-B regulation protein RsbU (phosphoserine phosphatase)
MINSAGAALLGRRPEEVVGREIAEILGSELARHVRERDLRVMEADHPMTFEETGRAGGTTRTLLSVKAPLRGPDGTVRGVVAIARDITGRKHLEEALARSEYRLQRILTSAREAFVGMDTSGRVTDWNPEAERMFGWVRKEALGRLLADLIIPPEHRQAHRRGLERFLETGQGPLLDRRVQVTAQDRHQERFSVELAVSAVQVGASCEFFAFLHEVGDRAPRAPGGPA